MLLELYTESLLFLFSIGMCTSYHFEEGRGFVLDALERLIRLSLGFSKLTISGVGKVWRWHDGPYLRLLRQPDPWECTVSYICSANNNVARISKIVEKIAEAFGRQIDLDGEVRHTFPTPEMVIKAGMGPQSVTLPRPRTAYAGYAQGNGPNLGGSLAAPMEYDKVLFEELRALRRRLADVRDVPAFVIFGDVSLRHMAEASPGAWTNSPVSTGWGTSSWSSTCVRSSWAAHRGQGIG